MALVPGGAYDRAMRSRCVENLRSVAVLALFLPLAACAGEHDTVEKQLAKLRAQVAEVQNENDRMSERLDAMEAQRASAPPPDQRVASAEPEAVTRPRLKVVRVDPEGDSAELAAAESEAEAAPRVVIQGEGKSLETRTLPAAKPAPKQNAQPSAKP